MVGKPQRLSTGQEQHVTRILRKKLLTYVLVGFAVLTGVTGASLWGIMKQVEGKMEELIARQFEEPRIQEVVRTVATERANTLMQEQITPEVDRFRTEVDGQLEELQALVVQTRELEQEIADIAVLAQPPYLGLTDYEVEQLDSGYRITFLFTSSKNEPLGLIIFEVALSGESNAHILDFWPANSGFSTSDDSKQIQPDGKQARLSYSLLGIEAPQVTLTVSDKTELTIHSNYLDEPISLRVE